MEDKKFKVIIVEDVKLELKGTEEIFRHEIPNAEVYTRFSLLSDHVPKTLPSSERISVANL